MRLNSMTSIISSLPKPQRLYSMRVSSQHITGVRITKSESIEMMFRMFTFSGSWSFAGIPHMNVFNLMLRLPASNELLQRTWLEKTTSLQVDVRRKFFEVCARLVPGQICSFDCSGITCLPTDSSVDCVRSCVSICVFLFSVL